ncbi:hypothetical protein L5B97_02205 [Avibacterium sp. 20-15]|uniref:hypothetical protein n=1 Tax=unclassified Avibacterium TaxID=2685287 RepID=UPI0020272E38|nr:MULTISPECIES: hypothetical protein [unclassified Avibacterium]MCW9732309.1 hypothetical protein [Avibacterium sp. 20-15]URL04476.1 hypothetical protein L4F93_00900 [Avibacterium sp. 20-132]
MTEVKLIQTKWNIFYTLAKQLKHRDRFYPPANFIPLLEKGNEIIYNHISSDNIKDIESLVSLLERCEFRGEVWTYNEAFPAITQQDFDNLTSILLKLSEFNK